MRAPSLLIVLGGAVACGSQVPPDPPPFVALASDFQAYASWTHFDVGDVPDPNGVDLAGQRTVYVNRLPPHGSTEFPIGTILVKIIQSGPTPEQWQAFGLVKRGGSYDLDGAPNWEWFGLAIDADNRVVIDWRGTGPPPDGSYGSLGSALGCVFCHASARANDYVQTPELRLSSF